MIALAFLFGVWFGGAFVSALGVLAAVNAGHRSPGPAWQAVLAIAFWPFTFWSAFRD